MTDMKIQWFFLHLISLLLLICSFLSRGVFVSYGSFRQMPIHIIVKSDGNIEPLGSPLSTFDNVTFELTADVEGSIETQRNGIILDGKGHVLSGQSTQDGCYIFGINDVIVRGFIIQGFSSGVHVEMSSEILLVNNTIMQSEDRAILIQDSRDTAVVGNTISNGRRDGISASRSYNLTVAENRVAGSNSGNGIFLVSSVNSTISNNHCSATQIGIAVDQSSFVNLSRNTAIGNSYTGISLTESSDVNVLYNFISDSGDEAIWMPSQRGGVSLVMGNTIRNSEDWGIWVGSPGTRIYNNNFINNTRQAVLNSNGSSTWNGDRQTGGNYWDTYAGHDEDNDGLGDQPYVLDANTGDIDEFPLMGPVSFYSTSDGHELSVVSNVDVSKVEYFTENKSIEVHSLLLGENDARPFLRVNVPSELISPPYSVDDGLDRTTIKPIFQNETLHIFYVILQNPSSVTTISSGASFSELLPLAVFFVAILTIIVPLIINYLRHRDSDIKSSCGQSWT